MLRSCPFHWDTTFSIERILTAIGSLIWASTKLHPIRKSFRIHVQLDHNCHEFISSIYPRAQIKAILLETESVSLET